jgi:hypothetical protein
MVVAITAPIEERLAEGEPGSLVQQAFHEGVLLHGHS